MSIGEAWEDIGRRVERRDAVSPGAMLTGEPSGTKSRVLPWSGAEGWKTRPPLLVPKGSRLSELSEAGFTTIELMVALLVMAILLAIAIPTFIGTTNTADDRSAESNLNTALNDGQSQFQADGQTYADSIAFAGKLSSSQPSLSFKPQGSSGSLSDISVAVSADGAGLVLGAYSLPGNCFYVVTNATVLSTASQSASPYSGGSAISTVANAVRAGAIDFPATPGTIYVKVTGDTTKPDCNAHSPKSSGPPATIQESTNGFPG